MKKLICVATALVLLAAADPGHAQQAASRGVAGVEKGPPRGFVYEGRPTDGDPPRWADFPVVRHVFSGSPALAAGLRVGDVILRVNGREGTETGGYRGGAVGSTYSLVVQRGFERVEISFVLVEPTWPRSEWSPPPGSYTTRP
jgi:S1-C subfamily serine protease